MSKSILSNEKKCYLCGANQNLDRHHIFFGTANRKLSEEDGCWVWLCKPHHTMSLVAVHQNRETDLILKKRCQEQWEKTKGTRDEFIKRYGKSYLSESKDWAKIGSYMAQGLERGLIGGMRNDEKNC